MKSYEEPKLLEVKVEIEDVVAKSGEFTFNDFQPGDVEHSWPWK